MLLNDFFQNFPTFTVIVNCRNSERFLSQCLESIQNQTHTNFEVIVWDNMSVDNTFQIASAYSKSDGRFKVFCGLTPLKLGEARNMAIRESQGRYIAFLDSDDLWHPNFLSDHIKVLDSYEQQIFGIGNVIEIDAAFRLTKDSTVDPVILNPVQPKKIFRKLLKGNTVYFSSLVIPKDFFDHNFGFKPNYVQAEDYELLLRASRNMKCYKTGLAYYRIHEGNATNSQQDALFVESIEILKSYNKHFWGWVTFKLTAARYFLYLDSPTYKSRLKKLKNQKIRVADLLIGAIILSLVTIKSEIFGKRAR